MFKIGDRVRCLVDNPDNNDDIHVGSTGTVVLLDGDIIGVEWDEYVVGHSCNGEAEFGYGWNVCKHEIELDDDGIQYEFNDDEFRRLIGF